MKYKTYKNKKIRGNRYAISLGDPPIYYVQPYESESGVIEILIGPLHKISSNPDFGRYCVISNYNLNKHFTPALDICSNIFIKV